MVQTPFTWRYGGRQVFLSGSFNGWSEKIPMILMEGSETVFQKMMDLPPGWYQYKFFVDGIWRVDQQQICDLDEYGIINNIVLVSVPGFTSTDFQVDPFQPSTSRVNPMVTPSVGSLSGGPLNEPVLQFFDGEMDVFRQVLSVHLLSATIYKLIPIVGKGLAVVPLWDENSRQIAGMLTASDFILILLQLHKNQAIFNNGGLQVRTISWWKGWKIQNYRDIIGTTVPFQRQPLIHAGPDESLADVALRILQNNISTVPIIHSVNGSCPRLLHITCLAGVLKNVCSHFKRQLGYPTLLQQPVGYLPLGTWAVEARRTSGRPLVTLHPNDTLFSALALLLKAQISSIPIVDIRGNFLYVYSRSDITSLAKDNIYTRIQLDQITISQALEFAGERGQNRYKTCTRFDSLYRVMELLSEPGVRRVIVVEASSRHIEGIITLRDVFAFFSR